MASLPVSPLKGISLLFIKLDDIVDNSTEYKQFPNGLDLIYAIEEVCGRGKIEGAQRIGKLYRIYIKCEKAKDQLITEGFSFKGRHVSFCTRNPFTVNEEPDTVKIIIGGVPLSVANSEFEKALIDLSVDMVSDLKFENYRDKDGKWTAYKTGRRFVYCKKPKLNLKPSIRIGLWNASLYYREQVRPTNRTHTKEGEQHNTGQTEVRNEDTVNETTANSSTTASDNVSDSVNSVSDSVSDRADDSVSGGVCDGAVDSVSGGICDGAVDSVGGGVSDTGSDGVGDSMSSMSNPNNVTVQPITGKPPTKSSVERGDDWPVSESQDNGNVNKPGRSRLREPNTLSHYFDRRSRSNSTKRKQMVSSKILPPPSKSAKNSSLIYNHSKPNISSNSSPDWYENRHSNSNET